MRQIYSRSFAVTFSTGDSGYVFAERIKPGYVLHVHSCSAYSVQREASDDVIIGIRELARDFILTSQAPLAAQRGVDAPNEFYLGEGDQAFAYFPVCDNSDVLELHINGVIMTREDWEKGME